MPEEDSTVRINGVDCRNFKEMILYKMDRTIAIVGIIILGCGRWQRRKYRRIRNRLRQQRLQRWRLILVGKS